MPSPCGGQLIWRTLQSASSQLSGKLPLAISNFASTCREDIPPPNTAPNISDLLPARQRESLESLNRSYTGTWKWNSKFVECFVRNMISRSREAVPFQTRGRDRLACVCVLHYHTLVSTMPRLFTVKTPLLEIILIARIKTRK